MSNSCKREGPEQTYSARARVDAPVAVAGTEVVFPKILNHLMRHPYTVAAEVVRLYVNDFNNIRGVLSQFEILQLKMALQRRPVDKSMFRAWSPGHTYLEDARILSLGDLLAGIDAKYAGLPPALIQIWHLSLRELLDAQRDAPAKAAISIGAHCPAKWVLKPLEHANMYQPMTRQVVQDYLANPTPSRSCSLITPEAKLKILRSAQWLQEGAYTPEDVVDSPERKLIIDFLSDDSRWVVDTTELEAALLRRHSLAKAVSRYFIGVPVDLVEIWQHRLTVPEGTLSSNPSFSRQKRVLHDINWNTAASSSSRKDGTRSRSRSLAAPVHRKSEPERKQSTTWPTMQKDVSRKRALKRAQDEDRFTGDGKETYSGGLSDFAFRSAYSAYYSLVLFPSAEQMVLSSTFSFTRNGTPCIEHRPSAITYRWWYRVRITCLEAVVQSQMAVVVFSGMALAAHGSQNQSTVCHVVSENGSKH
ncbi:hypothetical protein BDZ89DRAFT_1048322 [Hymenopellis radicata]|nr:hypothetical protein BDZ89DRAFT_1048322 [Hymenopellis radicata]